MCRSLSEVPKGLRPIRTTSGHVTAAIDDDANQLKGFGARLRWARQQCLRQSGNQHAAEPTPARVSSHAVCDITVYVFCGLWPYIYIYVTPWCTGLMSSNATDMTTCACAGPAVTMNP